MGTMSSSGLFRIARVIRGVVIITWRLPRNRRPDDHAEGDQTQPSLQFLILLMSSVLSGSPLPSPRGNRQDPSEMMSILQTPEQPAWPNSTGIVTNKNFSPSQPAIEYRQRFRFLFFLANLNFTR
jgi:hypothetical protein